MFDIIRPNNQTWLVCGGRDFDNNAMFDSAMGDLIRIKGMPNRIIHGGASGADSLCQKWAEQHAITAHAEQADWAKHGRAAGPIRNQKMLDDFKPALVVVFPGGRGTEDMVFRARKRGTDVAEIKATHP